MSILTHLCCYNTVTRLREDNLKSLEKQNESEEPNMFAAKIDRVNVLIVIRVARHSRTQILYSAQMVKWSWIHIMFHFLGALPLCIYLLYYKI